MDRNLARILSLGFFAGLSCDTLVAQQAPAAYRIDLVSHIAEKPFKFYVAGQPTSATCAMTYSILPGEAGSDVTLKSVHFTWKTSGLDIQKDVTPEGVKLRDNGSESIEWAPGKPKEHPRKDEKNPLDLFGKPILRLPPNGRGETRIWRNPEAYLRFAKNFNFGRAALLHRPKLPDGDLKVGQTFKTDVQVPDGTYSAVDWPLEVEWRVKSVEGPPDAAIAVIEGAGAATRDEYASRMGKLTDGTVSFSSTLKLKQKTGELISGESKSQSRWKKEPSGAPTGIMDYDATVVVTETRQEPK